MDELRDLGIEMIFVTTPAPQNGEEKILHGVKGLFAEYERMKIIERFRLGKLRKVKEGHILTTEAPYGYTYIRKVDKDHHGYYQINETEARVVKMIFTWVVDDRLTLRQIVKKLQELDIRPRKSKRGVWNTSTLGHLLRNRSYIGQGTYGKSYAVVPENPTNHEKYRKMRKTSRRDKPEKDWIAANIPVPAIIDKDLFTRAQEQLRINFEMSSRNKKNQYLLAGKIHCACGNRRTGEGPQHGKHLYYRCSNRVQSFPLPPTCLEKGINARIVDNLVWQKIAELMSSPESLIEQVDRWISKRLNGVQSSGVVIEDIEDDIQKLKKEEDRYVKAYGAGLFTMEQLREYTASVRDKISSLESQKAEARAKNEMVDKSMLPGPDEIRMLTENAVKMPQDLNFEARRDIVKKVVDRIIGTQNELQVYGFIPIEALNDVALWSIHRHCRSAERGEIHAF